MDFVAVLFPSFCLKWAESVGNHGTRSEYPFSWCLCVCFGVVLLCVSVCVSVGVWGGEERDLKVGHSNKWLNVRAATDARLRLGPTISPLDDFRAPEPNKRPCRASFRPQPPLEGVRPPRKVKFPSVRLWLHNRVSVLLSNFELAS